MFSENEKEFLVKILNGIIEERGTGVKHARLEQMRKEKANLELALADLKGEIAELEEDIRDAEHDNRSILPGIYWLKGHIIQS